MSQLAETRDSDYLDLSGVEICRCPLKLTCITASDASKKASAENSKMNRKLSKFNIDVIAKDKGAALNFIYLFMA